MHINTITSICDKLDCICENLDDNALLLQSINDNYFERYNNNTSDIGVASDFRYNASMLRIFEKNYCDILEELSGIRAELASELKAQKKRGVKNAESN